MELLANVPWLPALLLEAGDLGCASLNGSRGDLRSSRVVAVSGLDVLVHPLALGGEASWIAPAVHTAQELLTELDRLAKCLWLSRERDRKPAAAALALQPPGDPVSVVLDDDLGVASVLLAQHAR